MKQRMLNLFKCLPGLGICSKCAALKLERQSLTADIALVSRNSERRADVLKRPLYKAREENAVLKKQIHDALGKRKNASKRRRLK